jgi:DNA-binding protein YbaB
MKSMEEMIQAAQKAAETIQRQMEDAQGRLDGIEVEGAAGGGLVKIKASAKGRVIGVSIDDSLLVPADKGILEDPWPRPSTTRAPRPMRQRARKCRRCRWRRAFRRASSCRSDSALICLVLPQGRSFDRSCGMAVVLP